MTEFLKNRFLTVLTIGLAGLGQNVTSGIDYGNRLGSQPRNGGRNEVLNSLYTVGCNTPGTADIDDDTCLGRIGLYRKQIPVWQDQMNPDIANALKKSD